MATLREFQVTTTCTENADGSFTVGPITIPADTTTPPPPPPPPTGTGRPIGQGLIANGVSKFALGANMPWIEWGNDFGNNRFQDPAYLNKVKLLLLAAANAGMKHVRWWLFPGNPWQINRGTQLKPLGINQKVNEDLLALTNLCQQHGIKLHLVLFSGPTAYPATWRTNQEHRIALRQVLVQWWGFWKNNPNILSLELMNEPEWEMWNAGKVPQAEVVAFIAELAGALAPQATNQYVHVGSAYLDGISLWKGTPALEMYSPHWYQGNMASGNWNALGYPNIAAVRSKFGVTDTEPIVIGETYLGGPDAGTVLQKMYDIGYAGAWGWSLNSHGTQDMMTINYAAVKAWAATKQDVG